MEKMKWPIAFAILILSAALMAGCGKNKAVPDKNADPDRLAELNGDYLTAATVADGDFIYRLVVNKERYNLGEVIELYAELEYVGDEKSVVIFHAGSPFYFPIFEKSRQYDIPYNMIQPLLSTTLNKGEPLREYSTGGGGYSEDQDSKSYIAFMKEIMQNRFPVGEYVVSGFADFYVAADEKLGTEQQDYKIGAKVAFEVVK